MKIPMEKWQWKGLPGHLCVSNDCRFHLNTQIGEFKVSTVGAWYPPHKPSDRMAEIGIGKDYETYVFKGESITEIDSDSISLDRDAGNDPYKADELAEKMHMEFCLKYSNTDLTHGKVSE